MKFIDFKNGLTGGEVHGIYLLEGEDNYFLSRGLRLLRDKFVSEPDLNYIEYDGGEVSISDILSSLDMNPFMSEKRLTVVKEYYPDKKMIDTGLKYFLEDPSEVSLLVIVNSKPCDAIKKYPEVCFVDCGRADERSLIRWITAECNRLGSTINGETAQKIVAYCLSDMSRIEKETDKLCAYAGGREITVSDVDELVNRDAEYKIYEMTEYIGRRKFDLAISVVSDMLEKGDAPQKIIFSIYNYFRKLLHIAISDKTDFELAEIFGVKEFAIKKSREQTKLFKKKSLKKSVDYLSDLDYKSKCGRIDGTDGMWLAIFKIMTEE